jgi:hypothetical protein
MRWLNNRRLLEPIATSRRPRPRSTTTPRWTNQPSQRGSNETASGKPGAVQSEQYDDSNYNLAHLRYPILVNLTASTAIKAAIRPYSKRRDTPPADDSTVLVAKEDPPR